MASNFLKTTVGEGIGQKASWIYAKENYIVIRWVHKTRGMHSKLDES